MGVLHSGPPAANVPLTANKQQRKSLHIVPSEVVGDTDAGWEYAGGVQVGRQHFIEKHHKTAKRERPRYTHIIDLAGTSLTVIRNLNHMTDQGQGLLSATLPPNNTKYIHTYIRASCN